MAKYVINWTYSVTGESEVEAQDIYQAELEFEDEFILDLEDRLHSLGSMDGLDYVSSLQGVPFNESIKSVSSVEPESKGDILSAIYPTKEIVVPPSDEDDLNGNYYK